MRGCVGRTMALARDGWKCQAHRRATGCGHLAIWQCSGVGTRITIHHNHK